MVDSCFPFNGYPTPAENYANFLEIQRQRMIEDLPDRDEERAFNMDNISHAIHADQDESVLLASALAPKSTLPATMIYFRLFHLIFMWLHFQIIFVPSTLTGSHLPFMASIIGIGLLSVSISRQHIPGFTCH
jgi:hypothetical protein